MQRYWQLVKRIWQHFDEADCNTRAAALTFTSLLSLVPLMTISFAILSAFPVFKQISGHVQTFIFNNFVPATGDIVRNYLIGFVEKAGQMSAIGLAFLVVTALAMMSTMEQTFNKIWQINHQRGWISALILYWTILTLSPLLMGVGFAISSYIASLSFLSDAAHWLGLTRPLLAILPFTLSFCAFSLIYMAVPNCAVSARYACWGALLAAVLFEAAKQGFTLYIKHFATYEFLYGALAAIPAFLIWLYVCWFIILLGAVVSYVLSEGKFQSTSVIVNEEKHA